MKKVIAILLVAICVLSFPITVSAADLSDPIISQPTWAEVGNIVNTFTVNGYIGHITADVNLKRNMNCSMLVELQQYKNRDWETYDDWVTSGQGGCGVSATRALESGYQYRVHLTITVTDSATGELLETVYSDSSNQPFVE